MKQIPVLLFFLLLLTACSPATTGVQTITAQEAKQILDSGKAVLLLDVRTQAEFDAGHISGALLIPYDELEDRADELKDREMTILVYCRSGRRSAIAAQTLVDLGFQDVRDFGGITDWTYGTEP